MLLLANYLSAQKYGYRFQSEFIELCPTNEGVSLVQTRNGESLELESEKENKASVIQKISSDLYFVSNIKDVKDACDIYVSETFSDNHGNKLHILPTVCVSMTKGYSVEPILSRYKDILTLEDSLMNTYYLPCKLTTATEVLQIVSEIEELEGVEWCQPDILANCVSTYSTYYLGQWYLKSFVNSPYAINAVQAWDLVEIPSYMKVAIIDDGVDNNHESYSGCILDGYTVDNTNGKGAPQNANSYDNKGHGTYCAGIICATNDSTGVKGVAPGVKILPVNIKPNTASANYHGQVSDYKISLAIRWAVDHGAEILCLPWKLGAYDNNIVNAITYALQNGRSGKGCVVVASSGNDYPNETGIAFPASISGVISVGATDQYGILYDGSQRGSGLDIVAPGVGIMSTDRMGSLGFDTSSNYTSQTGTSASCAIVAGVAALMLSANGYKTSAQITDYLHSTARPLGTYTQNEVGYGLVDATAAVCMAGSRIIGSDYQCLTTGYYVPCIPPGAYVVWSHTGQGTSMYNLEPDSPAPNHCYLRRNNTPATSSFFHSTLTAQIIWGGSVFKTMTMNLIGNTGKIFTYDQPSCNSYYNSYYTFQEIENMPISPNETKFVPVGCLFVLKSGYFVGKTITTIGTPWMFDNHIKSEIQFVLAPPSASDSLTIVVGARACDDEVRFTFYPLPESGMIYAYAIDMTPEGEQHYKLAIGENEEYLSVSTQSEKREAIKEDTPKDPADTPAWSVNAINVKTGAKVLQEELSQPTYMMDTSQWEPGVYVVRAFTGGDVIFARKITVR